MSKNILIPYHGDLVTARLGYKAKRKQNLRKFKRDLLKLWDLSGQKTLWGVDEGYVNNKLRDLLGIKKNFMPDNSGLYYFGVELKPSADVNKVLALSEDDKDFLRNKCMAIFNKYGYTVKTKFKNDSFEYVTYNKDGIETEYDGQEDEELASILYDRVVMYMINNDSNDTTDNWSDHNEEVDFFNNDIRSKLKSFKYTFSSSELIKIINDRLFTKRNYRTIGGTGFLKRTVTANGIDMILFNELLDGGITDNVKGDYWEWNGSSYILKIDNVKALDEEEFMIFIQTHLGTFDVRPKKKWYQKGFWGVIFAIVIVVIAVLTQQYWLIGVGLGATLVVAGMIISITGALIGNQVMVVAGQIVSLVGGGISVSESIMAEQVAIDAMVSEYSSIGVLDTITIQVAVSELESTFLLNSMMGIGKFALSTYTTISSLQGETVTELGGTVTPAEKVNEIYVADDMSWDYVQRFLPDFIIANSLRLM